MQLQDLLADHYPATRASAPAPTHARFGVVFGYRIIDELGQSQLALLLSKVHRLLTRGGACIFDFLAEDTPGAWVRQAEARTLARPSRHGYSETEILSAYLNAGYDCDIQPLEDGRRIVVGIVDGRQSRTR
jgi:hypothetical protein